MVKFKARPNNLGLAFFAIIEVQTNKGGNTMYYEEMVKMAYEDILDSFEKEALMQDPVEAKIHEYHQRERDRQRRQEFINRATDKIRNNISGLKNSNDVSNTDNIEKKPLSTSISETATGAAGILGNKLRKSPHSTMGAAGVLLRNKIG